MSQLSVAEKYRQPEVVDFWRQFSLQGLQACEEDMLARYAPGSGDILDLGCGSGRASLALEPRGYRVTGLDITWEMVSTARDLCRDQQLEPRFTQGDMCALPYAGQSYDLALILIAALQHIPKRSARQQVFAEIARVLKPGGVLLVALDNLAPALQCYGFWGLQKLASMMGLQRPSQATASPPTDRKRLRGDTTSADKLLEARRVGMTLIGWHLRGMARTLRWRTWTGWIDVGRKSHLLTGEIGDTQIFQVSSTSTTGKVYYHLYQHEELVADAKVGGFELLGYHSGGELNAGKQFAPRARQLDKQVLYAFRRL